jgi:hypothetical protein
MTNDNAPRRRPRIWPGMPTPRGEVLQFLLLLSPSLIAIAIVLLLSVISMVRHLVR